MKHYKTYLASQLHQTFTSLVHWIRFAERSTGHLLVSRHRKAVRASTSTLIVEPQFPLHLPFGEILVLALEVAVYDWVRRDAVAVGAATHADSVLVAPEIHIAVVSNYLFEAVQSVHERLAILPEPSLKPHRVPSRPDHRYHELWAGLRSGRELGDILSPETVAVDPHDASEALYISLGSFADEVPNEEAFALTLDVPVMAFVRTGSSTTTSTESRGDIAG